MGVLRDLAYEYLTPIAATGGQCGGFIVNEIVPLLMDKRRVRYVGDCELRGPADQIEQNTKRYIETYRPHIRTGPVTKIALTEQQVNVSARLRKLAITKLDKRNKPAKEYKAVECEALGQGVLVRIIRKHLDSLVPEPLEVVREREAAQREQARQLLLRLRKRGRDDPFGSNRRA